MERMWNSAVGQETHFSWPGNLHAKDRTLVCTGFIAFLSLQIKPKIVVYM